MLKTVKRTLYVNGNLIADFTQDPMDWSELAVIEQITAQLELQEKPKGRAYVRNDASDKPRPLRKGRPKALQFKLKLLQAVSKMLLLGNEPAVKRHVVCLYIEHHFDEAAPEASDTAQP